MIISMISSKGFQLICSTFHLQVIDLITSEELDANENGEIWIHGPQIMKGFLNRPKETKEMIDDDGWLHTGVLP